MFKFIEDQANLNSSTQNISRAITSLKEELDAIDVYTQRAYVLDIYLDADLRNILEHSLKEELEHAAMLIEYLRKNIPDFNRALSKVLFNDEPIDTDH